MRREVSSSEVLKVVSLLNSRLRLQDLLPTVLDAALELTGADRSFLMVADRQKKLTIKAARNQRKEDLPEEDFSGSTSILQKVLSDLRPLYLPRVTEELEFAAAKSVRKWNLHSAICIPLLYSDSNRQEKPDLLGVVY